VTSAVLREAVLEAYGGQLAPDRYPFAVLFVDLPPETVDVNVHPRKMEVRFDDEAAVRRAVRESVESALLSAGLVRSSAPRGRSKAKETEVRPESPASEAVGEPERHGGRTDGRRQQPANADSRSVSSASAPTGPSTGAADDATETVDTDAETTAENDRAQSSAWHRREPVDDPHEPDQTDGADDADTAPEPEANDAAETREDFQTAVSETTAPDASTATDATETDDATEHRDSSSSERAPGEELTGEPTEVQTGASTGESTTDATRTVVGPATQKTLAGDAVDLDRTFDRLPRLRVLGQLHETYIVAASDEGILLVDQHAADERVNYERLKAELEGETPTQALASPVELELTAREAALFDQYQDALAQVGFHAGRVDDRVVEVRTVPAIFDATLDPDRLRDALTGFVTDERDGASETVDAAADELIADLACYPSVTGNTSLTEGSVVDLLEALDACDNPYACPHGRPTVIRVDRDEIEDRFERDYPGHAGRRAE
jgi:DNA mismatch repair protein MutL